VKKFTACAALSGLNGTLGVAMPRFQRFGNTA